MIDLALIWVANWYPFSRYERGMVVGAQKVIDRIYRHKRTGQIRLYSVHDLEGVQLSVNGESAVTLRARGRFGKLYLGFKEA